MRSIAWQQPTAAAWTYIIVPDEPGAETRECALPRGVHVKVQEGERVRVGEPLMDGPSNPHDILNVLGERALQSYGKRRSLGRSITCAA